MQKTGLRAATLLSAIEGCLIAYWLASFSVLSPMRILTLAIVVLISTAFLLAFFYLKKEAAVSKARQIIVGLNNRQTWALFILLLALTLETLALQKEYWLLYATQAIYERILPLAIWIGLLCVNFGATLLLSEFERSHNAQKLVSVLKRASLLLGISGIIWFFISRTHIGLTFDQVGLSWGTAGTPVTFPQIALVLTLSLWLTFLYLLLKRFFPALHPRWIVAQNIILFLAIWSLAVALWSHQSMSPTHFAPVPVPPNNEYYPSSDAQVFDTAAYHLLIGNGFTDHLVRRPLYVGMLAMFHAVGGPAYDDVIRLQLLLLGLIPALIFLIASGLSNRLSGLIAAGLILVREANSIALSGEIITSNAKLMMSDLMAALGILLTIAVAIPLLKKKNSDLWLAAILGACLGLTVLVRAQVVVLAPVLALWILLARRSFKLAFREWISFGLGLTLVLAPWLSRNWNLTHTLVLDDRGEERLMARNYSASPLSLPAPRPGESEKAFSARLKSEVVIYLREHPTDVAFFIGNHFLHNLVTSAVFLAPVYSSHSSHEVVTLLPFWQLWHGELPHGSAIALLINLSILALGIALAYEKHGLTGWLPLAAFLAYSAGNALARSSGWRFSLPIDWTVMVYFAIALAYVPSMLAELTGDFSIVEQTPQKAIHPAVRALLFAMLFLTGLAVPLAERLIPSQDLTVYAQQTRTTLSKEGILSEENLKDFLTQKNAVLLSGMDLYPRFYRPSGKTYYLEDTPGDMKYLHFWLIDQENAQVILPMPLPPSEFPHAAYVTVLGCQMDKYIEARVIVLHGATDRVYLPEPNKGFACP